MELSVAAPNGFNDMKKYKHRARVFAELSLQFSRDRKDVPHFILTSNPPRGEETTMDGINMYYFGRMLAEAKELSTEQYNSLISFCTAFLNSSKP